MGRLGERKEGRERKRWRERGGRKEKASFTIPSNAHIIVLLSCFLRKA